MEEQEEKVVPASRERVVSRGSEEGLVAESVSTKVQGNGKGQDVGLDRVEGSLSGMVGHERGSCNGAGIKVRHEVVVASNLGTGTESEVERLEFAAESEEGRGLIDGEVLGGENVGGSDGVQTSQEIEAVRTEANGVGGEAEFASMVEEPTGRETGVVVEEIVSVVKEESLVIGLVKDGAENAGLQESEPHSQSVDGGVGASLVVLGSSQGGTALLDEVRNPGTEFSVSTTSAVVKLAVVETHIVEGRDMVTAATESLDIKDESHGSDDLGVKPGDDALKGIASSSETNSALTENVDNSSMISKSLDEHAPAAVEGNVTSVDNEDMTCPSIEGMDTDAYSENFCFSVEELQATFEIANSGTENQNNALADQLLPYHQTQVVVEGEVAVSVGKVLQNSEIEQGIVTERFFDENVTHKATDINQASIEGKQEAATQCPQLKFEVVNGSTGNYSGASLDLATSCQSTGAVFGDEVTADDSKVSDTVKAAGSELKKYTRASLKNRRMVLISDKVQLETDQSFGKNAASVPAQAEIELSKLLEFQERVTHTEQVFGEGNYAEQSLGVEMTCKSTEIGAQVMITGETPIGSNGEGLITGNDIQEHAEGYEQLRVDEDINKSAAGDVPEIDSSMEQELTVEDHSVDTEQEDSHEGPEMEVEEQDTDSEHVKTLEEKSAIQTTLNSGSFAKGCQVSYQLQPDDKGEFCVSDLVWGKVRSHPWWPGQIFETSDASERAMKYHKKDCFLVAYFGDRTFAWNEASLLKPFRSHFSQVEKQSNSEVFQNAVTCALDEVSRRVELGLSCSCIPEDTCDRIKFQIVENTGIRQESSTREGVDKSVGVELFEPRKLVEYMKALAQHPMGGADRLDLVIAKSQLLPFYRLKGYYKLPDFCCCENADGLQFEDGVTGSSRVGMDEGQISYCPETSPSQRSSYHKRKHNLKDGFYSRKKEKSMSELMGESWDSFGDEIDLVSPSSGKKQKGSATFVDDLSEGRRTISLAKVSTIPKPSFKIGECIRRVASQMTGSPSILKSNVPKLDGSSDGLGNVSEESFQHSEDAEMKSVIVWTEYSSIEDLMAQLFLAAQDPFGGFSFSKVITSFFSDFRNSVVDEHDGDGKRKALLALMVSPETFEFEDMSDTYWTDRVIQNGSEDQQPRKSRKRGNQLVPVDMDKPYKRSNSRKRFSVSSGDISVEKPVGYVDENAPAELVMHFPVVDSVPSETNLNRMFRCFGPLKESDTEVDRDTNRARVVFKRCSDAEAAYGSAPKFNIFGQTLVNYQLNYIISVPFKTPAIVTTQGEVDATLFLEY